MSDLVGIPALFMRGGTSSGPYWNAKDLPDTPEQRDRVLLAAMGSTDGLTDEVDPSQLGGVGGGTPVTSKTAILSVATPTVSTSTTYLLKCRLSVRLWIRTHLVVTS